MRAHAIAGFLLLASPALAQEPASQQVFSANPKSAYESGTGTIDGATGTFINAVQMGSNQIAELATWEVGDSFRGKRVRITTRLKLQTADRTGCSLAVWDDTHMLKSVDGPIFAGSTGWKDCVVVMQVPDTTTRLAMRYFLQGVGKVWSDGFRVETVGADVAETHRINPNMTRNGDDR